MFPLSEMTEVRRSATQSQKAELKWTFRGFNHLELFGDIRMSLLGSRSSVLCASTAAQTGQTNHWLQRAPCTFSAAALNAAKSTKTLDF